MPLGENVTSPTPLVAENSCVLSLYHIVSLPNAGQHVDIHEVYGPLGESRSDIMNS